MLRQHEQEARAADGPGRWGDPWDCAEVLRTLTELNEQCLELLAEEAMLNPMAPAPMLRELTDLWRQLDGGARRRAAACPYLLIDAGFADPARWCWVSGQGVGDREAGAYGAFFTVAGLTKLAHQIFTNAWYIVRTQPIGAPLYLGMPSYCANLLRKCSMRQIADLAIQHAGWLRPRWSGRVQVWRELLVTALSGEGVQLERARMHGVQLLATELRALEQVHASGRK